MKETDAFTHCSVFERNLLGRRKPGLLRKAKREAELYQVSPKSGKAMPGTPRRHSRGLGTGLLTCLWKKQMCPGPQSGGLYCPERGVGAGEEGN